VVIRDIGRTQIAVLCIFNALMQIGACSRLNNMILELKDVQFFKAQETSASPRTIRLSGLAFHSALAVRDVTATQNGASSLQVLVHLMPTAPGLSGNFTYEFVVPDSVNTVTFGNEDALIWRRDTGFIKR
jgi:hypothetical protein